MGEATTGGGKEGHQLDVGLPGNLQDHICGVAGSNELLMLELSKCWRGLDCS